MSWSPSAAPLHARRSSLHKISQSDLVIARPRPMSPVSTARTMCSVCRAPAKVATRWPRARAASACQALRAEPSARTRSANLVGVPSPRRHEPRCRRGKDRPRCSRGARGRTGGRCRATRFTDRARGLQGIGLGLMVPVIVSVPFSPWKKPFSKVLLPTRVTLPLFCTGEPDPVVDIVTRSLESRSCPKGSRL